VLLLRRASTRAHVTIRRIALDADDLLEHYDAWVQSVIEPIAGAVEACLPHDVAGARAAWKKMRTMLFSRTAPFKALAYDVLDARFPRALRATLGVALPRP
jgi:hypothetical protein